MQKFQHNYIGVVVQNNDPEMRGRVKIFVPHVSSTVYTSWDESKTDKIFNFVDNPDIQPILEELKKMLPWAEYAGPIFGGCASGRYNAKLKKGTTSDANAFEGDNHIDGYRPLNIYTNEVSYPDAFSATGKVSNAAVNPYAYQYMPSNYSNLARGSFSIPNVGSHVWVWFMDGDSNYPVYFAAAYGAEDIKRIYTMSQKTGLEGDDASSPDYPASYENNPSGQSEPDNKTFRSKHVFNSNKNTIEMIDTDGRESLKMTQYSGSFIELNNDVSTRLATKNDQLMVLGDRFQTIWKNDNLYIGGDSDLIVSGDSLEKIGKQNNVAVSELLDIYRDIHQYKRLFDVQRTAYAPNDEVFKRNFVSPIQQRQGYYSVCPVCGGRLYIQRLWDLSPIPLRLCLPLPMPIEMGGFPGRNIWVPGIPPLLSMNGQIGYKSGRHCAVCNRPPSFYTYDSQHRPGYSPSSENGFWQIETMRQLNGDLSSAIQMSNNKIMDMQAMLGMGGDKVSSIARNMIVTVGLVMNDLESYRVDSRGKLKTHAIFVAPEESYITAIPTPHVEHVDVDALPGGDIIFTATNKMKFLVGANGINIKTYGPLEMYGTISNITSEQMNLITKHELFIDGGEKLSLRGRHISLNPFEHNPVLVDGGFHVSRNTVIKGGAFVEGELGLLHVTAPREWHKTEGSGCITFLTQTLGPIPPAVPFHVHNLIIQLPDHHHMYESIPMTLGSCREEARDMMIQMGINENKAMISKPVINPLPGIESASATDVALTSAFGDNAAEDIISTINGSIDITRLQSVFGNVNASENGIQSALANAYAEIRRISGESLSNITRNIEFVIKQGE